ncbi:hypothetical protein OPT61_g3661 [Boeremia exigua]|uniref:Uncharacterized protein n=1 Tax=Boeremia exigua TaxID=749465 RepID=A0ACC2IH77_9PLEO|nr:hypothetical protein OPT61_g3661 [Boeremia exigua]
MGNLCCISWSNTYDEIETTQTLTLERVLTVFLLCFEAAIDSLPFYPPVPSTTRLVSSSSIPSLPSFVTVWEFTRDHSVAPQRSPRSLEAFPAWYRAVHRSLSRQNLCDHFCLLMDDAVRSKLEELHLGTSRCVRFPPRPLALYAEIKPDQPSPTSHLEKLDEIPPPWHSVLEITTSEGEKLIFDGTPEQFGWNHTGWTMDKSEIEENYVDGQEEMIEFGEERKRMVEQYSLIEGLRPWGKIYDRMEELLEELDWDSFYGLEDKILWERIRMQAYHKFENVGPLRSEETN